MRGVDEITAILKSIGLRCAIFDERNCRTKYN
jgi:hypothetical protein